MSDKTLKDFRGAREELAKKIFDMVSLFQKEYDVTVENIDISQIESRDNYGNIRSNGLLAVHVEVDV
jgi:hypothetical protein